MSETGNYRFEGGRFYSIKNGKEVALLDPTGNVTYLRGMAGPHKENLEAWIKANKLSFGASAADDPMKTAPEKPESTEAENKEKEGTADLKTEPEKTSEAAVNTPPASVVEKPKAAQAMGRNLLGADPDCRPVDDIPDSQLPRFDRTLGIETPGLRDFIRRHKLTAEDTEKLVRRLEARPAK